MCRNRCIEGAIERRMIPHVDDFATNRVAELRIALRLGGDPARVNIEYGDPRTVFGERLGIAEPQPAGTAR